MRNRSLRLQRTFTANHCLQRELIALHVRRFDGCRALHITVTRCDIKCSKCLFCCCSAAEEINASLGTNNVTTLQLDVAQFASIRKFADDFLARNEPLHILINNAGTLLLSRGRICSFKQHHVCAFSHSPHFVTRFSCPLSIKHE